jgi:predicted permease
MLARPFVAIVSRFAARVSVRALEVTPDATVLWVGAGLAMAASVLLAYVPRLPSRHAPAGLGLASGSLRITPGTNRRLRMFATTQIAFSFVLLAGAGTLVSTLVNRQTANTGFDMNALVIDIPTSAPGVASGDRARLNFYQEATTKIRQLPGIEGAATGSFVPWRDAGTWGPPMSFAAEGYTPANGEDNPRARFRIASPGYFAVLGVPLIAGRDFADGDRSDHEPVAIVSQSLAQRLFPNGDAVNRHVWWTESVSQKPTPRRIVGIVADVDDESVVRGAAMAVYQPVQQIGVGGRLFVRTAGDPHAVVPAVERVIRELAADQPVERAATLEDVRAEILSSDRVSAFVFSGFAGMALLIAVVGVAGVLAFSVSARTREFGVRLAVGSAPRQILGRVFLEGVVIAGIGIAVGAVGGYALARAAAKIFATAQMPGALPLAVAAAAIIAAASIASLLPAARASRVDVLQALRSE